MHGLQAGSKDSQFIAVLCGAMSNPRCGATIELCQVAKNVFLPSKPECAVVLRGVIIGRSLLTTRGGSRFRR